MFTANLLPGQGFQPFYVYRNDMRVTSTGRPVEETIKKTEIEFLGFLMQASQTEKDQWKQNGHPITHKVMEFSAQAKAAATDYLVTESGREFYVQGVKNPGDMNVTMYYYVEERFDVKKRTE